LNPILALILVLIAASIGTVYFLNTAPTGEALDNNSFEVNDLNDSDVNALNDLNTTHMTPDLNCTNFLTKSRFSILQQVGGFACWIEQQGNALLDFLQWTRTTLLWIVIFLIALVVLGQFLFVGSSKLAWWMLLLIIFLVIVVVLGLL